VPEDNLTEDVDSKQDQREEAEFEILYKQNVTSEDAYLNMGMKDASSNHCDSIVIKVKLPGSKFKDVNLQVTSTKLFVGTPTQYV
jgi:HSP20 family molecular chaperone IbpA